MRGVCAEGKFKDNWPAFSRSSLYSFSSFLALGYYIYGLLLIIFNIFLYLGNFAALDLFEDLDLHREITEVKRLLFESCCLRFYDDVVCMHAYRSKLEYTKLAQIMLQQLSA
jgi:hypothetical protein